MAKNTRCQDLPWMTVKPLDICISIECRLERPDNAVKEYEWKLGMSLQANLQWFRKVLQRHLKKCSSSEKNEFPVQMIIGFLRFLARRQLVNLPTLLRKPHVKICFCRKVVTSQSGTNVFLTSVRRQFRFRFFGQKKATQPTST